ncbi:tol-pal system YbgF family protein [Bacteroidota bacterium]
MFKGKQRQLIILLFSIIILCPGVLYGQDQDSEVAERRSKAIELFEAGSFSTAEYQFTRLYREFPEVPLYRYYLGVCKVELDTDLDQAIELLFFASTRGVPANVFYYLGEAYRRKYDFERARKAYTEFDRLADKEELKRRNSKLLISSATEAIRITKAYHAYQIQQLKYVDLRKPEDYGKIRMKGGVMTSKPVALFTPHEDRDDLNSLMFMPDGISRGDKIYYSGTSMTGKDGFQLMEATRGTAGKWIKRKTIDIINTEHNEILPYFDPVEQDLYFASDGLNGLGGFDVYRSHYDEERNEWSEPINLGFPANSVYDDYLLLPGTDLGEIILFSGRQVSDTSVAVYYLRLSEPKVSLETATPQKKMLIANFGGAALRGLEALRTTDYSKEVDKESETERIEQETEPNQFPVTEQINEPQELIVEALRYQAASDSLLEHASAARIEIRSMEDQNEKWKMQREILLWEKSAKEEQEKAQEIFLQIAGFPREKSNDVIEPDTVINEMTVYRYILKDSITSAVQAVPGDPAEDSDIVNTPKQLAQENSDDATLEQEEKVGSPFALLDASPYSRENPFPMNEQLPEGVVYKIQLGVFSKVVEYDAFGGLSPISGEEVPNRDLTRYYAGKFSKFKNAESALPLVRSFGFNDAFIVCWYNNSRIAPEKAQKLE